MKEQIRLFFTALMFYTRIPVPGWVGFSSEQLNRATGYFPLVGVFVGMAGALVYMLSCLLLGSAAPAGPFPSVSSMLPVLLCMLATILITGAFHEDAIADFCDGFGGGTDKASILSIMKDSRMGAFGAIGLVMCLLLRGALLMHIPPGAFFAVFLAGNALSRLSAVGLIYTARYVRQDGSGKSKPVGEQHGAATWITAVLSALLPVVVICLYLPGEVALASDGPALLLRFGMILPLLGTTLYLFRRYVVRKIGGYTGDVLGALQQISELVFYLSVLLLLRFYPAIEF